MKGWRGSVYETNAIILRDREAGNGDKGTGTGEQEPGNREQETGNRDQGPGTSIQIPGIGSPTMFIKHIKKVIQQEVIEAYGKNKVSGLVLGMLIGDRSQIPESEYQDFIDSGLVHLVAVSGGNILMIVVFLHFILFFLPFYIRVGVILVTITGYGLLCGLDSSVFRAVLMGGLSMIALFRGREVNIWRLMSMSALVMLLINPYFLVYDVGFLLSYSALVGIVYIEETRDKEAGKMDSGRNPGRRNEGTVARDQEPGPKFLVPVVKYIYKQYLSPSIGASIGIFPIIIFFMGKINLISILGNLLVLPIIPFIMIYGFVGTLMYHWL